MDKLIHNMDERHDCVKAINYAGDSRFDNDLVIIAETIMIFQSYKKLDIKQNIDVMSSKMSC